MGSEKKPPWDDLVHSEWHRTGDGIYNVVGEPIAFCRNHLIAERIANDHNQSMALANIPDPIAWVEAVGRLVEAVRDWADHPRSVEAGIKLAKAGDALLALQSPREEEKGDGE